MEQKHPYKDSEKGNMKPSWNIPPTLHLVLGKDVHIWRAILDLPGRSVREFKEDLTVDERIKSERFRFERDRSRFIAARGILRRILGCYLGIEPGAVRLCSDKRGKPRLQNAKTDIQFNLSHSEGLALYVFTRVQDVGVDIECIREISEMEQIAEQFFSARDKASLGELPSREKMEAFFKLWTRKEAFLKATGEGLTNHSDKSGVSAARCKSLKLSGMFGESQEGPIWSMWDVTPAEGFAGAVVVEGEGWGVQCWQWPD